MQHERISKSCRRKITSVSHARAQITNHTRVTTLLERQTKKKQTKQKQRERERRDRQTDKHAGRQTDELTNRQDNSLFPYAYGPWKGENIVHYHFQHLFNAWSKQTI